MVLAVTTRPALGQNLQRVAALQPLVQLNFWDDITGTGGAYGDTALQRVIESTGVEVLRKYRVPTLTDGALKTPNAAFLAITVTLRRAKEAPDSYLYGVDIRVQQPAVLRTGVSTGFASFWEAGPDLGITSESRLSEAVEKRVRSLVTIFAQEYRESNHD